MEENPTFTFGFIELDVLEEKLPLFMWFDVC